MDLDAVANLAEHIKSTYEEGEAYNGDLEEHIVYEALLDAINDVFPMEDDHEDNYEADTEPSTPTVEQIPVEPSDSPVPEDVHCNMN